jgi:hypothetical protein
MAGVKGRSGGKRANSGRPTKVEESLLTEKLSPLDDTAFAELKKGVKAGDFQYIKMFFEYRFGKPKQTIDNNHSGEMNITWHEELTD